MASYGTVTRSTLFTNLWNNIFKALEDNLTDPAGRTGVKWIWGAFPVKIINDKDSYPFVVVEPISLSSSEDYSFTKEVVTATVSVSIFTVDPDQLDTLSDDVIDIIYDNASTFGDYAMEVLDVVGTSYAHQVKSKSFRVHARTIRFSFKVAIS